MTRSTRVTVTLLAAIVLATISAFVGGSVGFVQGYVYGRGDTSAKAATMTTALRALRKGNVVNAVSSLESDLDVLIMEHWSSRGKSTPPILSWFFRAAYDDAADRKLLAHVARYRDEYPSSAEGQEVRNTISSHLKRFQ